MKQLQKLGKALMLPVAVLPICGILMGLGYLLCPAYMMGSDVAAELGYATSGAAYSIGFFLIKAGGALIDNMAVLFAVGVAGRTCRPCVLADDHQSGGSRREYCAGTGGKRDLGVGL